MYSVLFVCTANICRSPVAMGILRSKTRQEDDGEWRIESAGVWAREGDPAEYFSQIIVKEKGIDLSQHRSQRITAELMREFNSILTMEMGQKEGLKAAYPKFAKKIFLITEMVDNQQDIVDPYGSSLHDFQDTARELEWIIDRGYQRIRQLAEGKTNAKAKGKRS